MILRSIWRRRGRLLFDLPQALLALCLLLYILSGVDASSIDVTSKCRCLSPCRSARPASWSGLTAVRILLFIPGMSQLRARSPEPGGRFGATLSISQDGLYMAATSRWVPAVEIYRREGPDWVPLQTLTASPGDGADSFGAALSLDSGGSRLAVGDPGFRGKGQ
jgi:hypothetical protein